MDIRRTNDLLESVKRSLREGDEGHTAFAKLAGMEESLVSEMALIVNKYVNFMAGDVVDVVLTHASPERAKTGVPDLEHPTSRKMKFKVTRADDKSITIVPA